jgi:endonuclease/exonuclease/phosphatase family metal-dependent hydrolase
MKTNLYLTYLFIGSLAIVLSCQETAPPPVVPDIPTDYTDCLSPLSSTTLDIITWNLEQFSTTTTDIDEVINIISQMDADIIGIQEIISRKDFDDMVAAIDGWEGIVLSLSGLNTGYLYKTSEITLNGNLTTLYDDNSNAFPRPPIVGLFTHVSGLEFTLINLHLKCCGGSDNEDRRREAATLLKLYIDDSLSTAPVLVVGDYNDLIEEPVPMNVFQEIINDSLNYRFTDMDIARGSAANWSYPSWPSHLDHILMTNEFFDSFESSTTLLLNDCNARYERTVSDHRPVLARFTMQ